MHRPAPSYRLQGRLSPVSPRWGTFRAAGRHNLVPRGVFIPPVVLCRPFSVYPDGRVCISILHSPGDDPNGYEQANERWSPVQTVREPFRVVCVTDRPFAADFW